MRTRAAVAVAAMLVALAAPAARVRADGCFGSDHYTYDHGVCSSAGDDMLDVMRRAGDESYRMDQAGLDRLRAAGPSGGGASGGGMRLDAHRYPIDLVRLLALPKGPPQTTARMAAAAAAGDRARATIAKRFYDRVLRDYQGNAARVGLHPYNVMDARLFLVEAGYLAAGAATRSDQPHRALAYGLLGRKIVDAPAFAESTLAQRRALYERDVVLGQTLLIGAQQARDRRDARLGREVAGFARATLRGVVGIDPTRTRFDDLACALQPMPGFTCAAQMSLSLPQTRAR